MSSKMTLAVLVAVMMAGGRAATPDEKADKAREAGTPLKVHVVFSRYQGEKKVSSVPYTLAVNADDDRAALRAGFQVPLMVNLGPDKGTTVMYKDVGNAVDCSAHTLADGRFKLVLKLEQASVYGDDATPRAPTERAAFHAPVIQRVSSQTNLILRDGQSTQYVAATDPISGEVLKIEVTLNLVK